MGTCISSNKNDQQVSIDIKLDLKVFNPQQQCQNFLGETNVYEYPKFKKSILFKSNKNYMLFKQKQNSLNLEIQSKIEIINQKILREELIEQNFQAQLFQKYKDYIVQQHKNLENIVYRIKLNVEGFKKSLAKKNEKLEDSLIYKITQIHSQIEEYRRLVSLNQDNQKIQDDQSSFEIPQKKLKSLIQNYEILLYIYKESEQFQIAESIIQKIQDLKDLKNLIIKEKYRFKKVCYNFYYFDNQCHLQFIKLQTQSLKRIKSLNKYKNKQKNNDYYEQQLLLMNCWEDPQFIDDLSKIETIILTDQKFDYLDLDEYLKQNDMIDRQKNKENEKQNQSQPQGNHHSLIYVSFDNFEGRKLFNFKDYGIQENNQIEFSKFDEFSNYDWSQHIMIHEQIKIMISEMIDRQMSKSQ